MNDKVRISVLTPVYNRADKIHRVFDSLEKSTYKNFELIILDDGSTDNIAEVVKQYQQKVSYPVTFRRKENGGKHTALNVLHQLANGEYVFQLDSDDEIIPDAMEKALEIWDSMDLDKKKEYWCVVGRVVDQHERKIHGKLFPERINELEWKDIKGIMRKTPGEKWALQRADVLRKYKFPEPKGVKYVTESILWNLIQNDYKEYLTNEVFRVYYIDEGDCISSPHKTIQWAKNKYFSSLYALNRKTVYTTSLKGYWKLILQMSICYLLLQKVGRMDMEDIKIKNKMAMLFTIPCVWICLPLIKKKIGWSVGK